VEKFSDDLKMFNTLHFGAQTSVSF